MRTLTSNMATKAAAQYGGKPMVVVKIEWGGAIGTKYYSDEDITIDATVCQGRIISISEVASQGKEEGIGSVASLHMVLDDTNPTTPTIKTIIDSIIIEAKKVTVYHWFDGLALADLVPMMVGKISSPIAWSEGVRQLSFDIVSNIEDNPIGFAPEEGDVSDIFKDAIGKAWPMVFGNCINVPAVRLTGSANGKLIKRVTSDDGPGDIIYVDGGENFPQGTTQTIKIGTTIYTGVFAGQQFTITTANVPIYTNILWATRVVDADQHNSKVAWLNVSGGIKNLAGQWVYMSLDPVTGAATPQVNFCVKQEGSKCFFSKDWNSAGNVHEITNLDAHAGTNESATLFRETWSPSVISFTYGFNWEVKYTVTHTYDYIRWWWNEGSFVRLDIPDVYVANVWASSAIVDVKAYRKIEGEKDKKLVSIPTDYYTVDLSDSIAGETPTTITFDVSLYNRVENWDDQIYVTLRSTVSSNTATAIKYLLDTYSNLTTHAGSFTSVATALANYPSHFALFEQENVLKIVSEMAWQARCALRIEADSVSIKYLGIEPSTDMTLTETNIELKSTAMTYTETENLLTQITAKWQKEYSDKADKKQLVYKNNVDTFGLKKADKSFYIYTTESLVQKSLNFWGYRLSNVFRKITCDNFLTTLKLELFDTVLLGLTNSGLYGAVRGIVEELSLKEDDCTISMQLLLASKAGTLIEDVSFWQDDSGDSAIADPTADITPTVFANQTVSAINGNGDLIAFNAGNFGSAGADAPSGTTALILGKIASVVGANTYTVDLYENGYASAVTDAGISVTCVGTKSSYKVGDEVIVNENDLGDFIQDKALRAHSAAALGTNKPTLIVDESGNSVSLEKFIRIISVAGTYRVCLDLANLYVYDSVSGLTAALSTLLTVRADSTNFVAISSLNPRVWDATRCKPLTLKYDTTNSKFRPEASFLG